MVRLLSSSVLLPLVNALNSNTHASNAKRVAIIGPNSPYTLTADAFTNINKALAPADRRQHTTSPNTPLKPPYPQTSPSMSATRTLVAAPPP
jgi:hypothetical protein